MIIRVIAIMAAAFLLTGCGKKQEATVSAPQPTPPPVQSGQSGQPAQPRQSAQPSTATDIQQMEAQQVKALRPPVITAPKGTNAAPDLAAISRLARGWSISHREPLPASFEQWVAMSGAQVPPPPPGKKYAFDRKNRVILADVKH